MKSQPQDINIVNRPSVYFGTDVSGCMAESLYDWYVNAAVWSLVYRKIQTVWDECWIPFGMRALCSQEKSHPLNSSIFAFPHFSSLLLWLYHQRERTHISRKKNWGRRLCFVNNTLIIICTYTWRRRKRKKLGHIAASVTLVGFGTQFSGHLYALWIIMLPRFFRLWQSVRIFLSLSPLSSFPLCAFPQLPAW